MSALLTISAGHAASTPAITTSRNCRNRGMSGDEKEDRRKKRSPLYSTAGNARNEGRQNANAIQQKNAKGAKTMLVSNLVFAFSFAIFSSFCSIFVLNFLAMLRTHPR
jgi:hypothetical protein